VTKIAVLELAREDFSPAHARATPAVLRKAEAVAEVLKAAQVVVDLNVGHARP
jgi:hypothetical protein